MWEPAYGVREQRKAVYVLSMQDTKAMMRFATLERKLLGEYPLYVSNFDKEVIRHLSGNSPAGRGMEIALYIASDGNRDVARCGALINPKYQEAKNEKVGFIGYFAAAPNSEINVNSMLEHAEAWLKERGIKRGVIK